MFTGEGLNPLDCNGSDNGVERVVNRQVVETNVVEQAGYVVVGEELEVFLGDGETIP